MKVYSEKRKLIDKLVKRLGSNPNYDELGGFSRELNRLPKECLQWIEAGLDAAVEAGRVQGNEEYASQHGQLDHLEHII